VSVAEARLVVDGRDVAAVRVADSGPARLRGLLGTAAEAGPPFARGALLLTPGNSVHGWGMRYDLDVAQLDAGFVVVRVVRLRRGGLVAPRRGVRHVLEAQRGAFEAWGLAAGSHVSVR
jgi:uncharacterized membrane protein (UPF0127 family)